MNALSRELERTNRQMEADAKTAEDLTREKNALQKK